MKKTVTVQHLANVIKDTQDFLKNGHVSKSYYSSQIMACLHSPFRTAVCPYGFRDG